MKRKLLTICIIGILVVSALGVYASFKTPSADVVKSVQSLAMFSGTKWSVHYRAPNTDQIGSLLEAQGISMTDAAARELAIKTFQTEWAKRNPTTPNPAKLQKLLANERSGKLDSVAAGVTAAAVPQIMSLAVPVEFPNSDTFTWCEEEVTTTGPLHNQIPAPGPRDNNTIWYANATPALYSSLYFGVGPKAGVIVNHPNLGTLDFRGYTMANYYLEQSEGKFTPKGLVYPKWLQAAHSEGWYGQDSCDTLNHNTRARDLVAEVVDAVNVDNPTFNWQAYDGDGDGIVDNFTVIHAGMGQEAGGGQQGNFSIWSHASGISYPNGKLACAEGATGCPDRNIYVREYSMDPESLDVGVIAEEFGHAAFGLPDIYTLDAQGSPSNWSIMESGSWNGKLGGMVPAPFPLFFRYLIGWANPVVLDYQTGPQSIKVGQLSLRPKGTQQGIKINLPDTEVIVQNPLGTGQAWWSDNANSSDFTLTHTFDLTGTTAPIFSFLSNWSIEDDWDYGYVEVSEDAGATWAVVQDMDGYTVNTNPNGTNQGWGLTGEDQDTVRYDLSDYAGETILLRLRYSTDTGTTYNGWFADNFELADGATTLFSDDVSDEDGWTTDGNWKIVPFAQTFPLYYLAEWRNSSGFDKGLATAYTTIYNNPNTTEWQVDRCPYTVPGMVLWLRDAFQPFDYNLYGSVYDSPSWGPKHALLVVDSHYWPLEWNAQYTTGAGMRLNSRCQPGNAAFTLQGTKAFTARRAADAAGNIAETKTFVSLPAVSQFHDSLGYYPGFYYPGFGSSLYWWDKPASLAVPASGDYTTRVTNVDKTPLYDFYGMDFGGTFLGSGDPRDSGVQYGVNIAVLNKATDGSWGQLVVWNAKSLGRLRMNVNKWTAKPGDTLMYELVVRNISPAKQPYSLSVPIPANTTYVKGKYYKAGSNSVEWTGTLAPNQNMVFYVWVKVNAGTPAGTEIVNFSTLWDDANGANASVTITVK